MSVVTAEGQYQFDWNTPQRLREFAQMPRPDFSNFDDVKRWLDGTGFTNLAVQAIFGVSRPDSRPGKGGFSKIASREAPRLSGNLLVNGPYSRIAGGGGTREETQYTFRVPLDLSAGSSTEYPVATPNPANPDSYSAASIRIGGHVKTYGMQYMDGAPLDAPEMGNPDTLTEALQLFAGSLAMYFDGQGGALARAYNGPPSKGDLSADAGSA